MPVEELAAVVTIKAQQLKRQGLLHLPRGLDNPFSPFVPNRSQTRPAAVNVGIRHTPDEVSFQALATVGDGVGFQISRPRHIPVVRPNGNMMLKQASGFSSATPTMLQPGFVGCQ